MDIHPYTWYIYFCYTCLRVSTPPFAYFSLDFCHRHLRVWHYNSLCKAHESTFFRRTQRSHCCVCFFPLIFVYFYLCSSLRFPSSIFLCLFTSLCGFFSLCENVSQLCHSVRFFLFFSVFSTDFVIFSHTVSVFTLKICIFLLVTNLKSVFDSEFFILYPWVKTPTP